MAKARGRAAAARFFLAFALAAISRTFDKIIAQPPVNFKLRARGGCPIISRIDSRIGPGQMNNALYYGDNLGVLRTSIASESVDLIYLDPPFNSSASYNVLFKAPSGEGSQAQIEAFGYRGE